MQRRLGVGSSPAQNLIRPNENPIPTQSRRQAPVPQGLPLDAIRGQSRRRRGMKHAKKLIEVALPLEASNKGCRWSCPPCRDPRSSACFASFGTRGTSGFGARGGWRGGFRARSRAMRSKAEAKAIPGMHLTYCQVIGSMNATVCFSNARREAKQELGPACRERKRRGLGFRKDRPDRPNRVDMAREEQRILHNSCAITQRTIDKIGLT